MKLIYLLFCCAFFIQTQSIKLNFPRVLLPVFQKISINFTLEVIEGGCFKWTSSRTDLISIKPIINEESGGVPSSSRPGCSSKAIVTTISRENQRHTAIVLAENLATGEILRCDVILDVIDQLGVLTTTRELYLEEAPETFELWAVDSQGNAFTTLEGIEFTWKIEQKNSAAITGGAGGSGGVNDRSWQQVLKFLTFSQSKYHEVPKSVERFESLGLKGYMVLLEGINTGSAKVIVKLPYAEYAHVAPVEVYIMVLANIILDPVDAHILVGDIVQFRILQLKQGKLEEISLNTQYYLEIEDTQYASINGNMVHGQKLGKTGVILRDRNVPVGGYDDTEISGDDQPKAPSPRASLTITEAKKITLNLLPHFNWITVVAERHEIAVDLYTHDDNKIILGSQYKVNVEFDKEIFYPISQTKNNSRIFGEAITSGNRSVLASFENLATQAELQIFDKLTLMPQKVILPFDPNNIRRQQVQFVANGGDGSYIWSTSSNLVGISQTGLADVQFDQLNNFNNKNIDEIISENMANSVGSQVRVALSKNQQITKTADILFLLPEKLQIVWYNFETALNDYVIVHVALYARDTTSGSGGGGGGGKQLVPFTRCENLNFELDFSNEIFIVDNSMTNKQRANENSLQKHGCRLLFLRGTQLGTTQLRVTYQIGDRLLKDEVTLMVFEPLDILNPHTNEIILPIGASRNIIYTNGPQKVFNIAADLMKKATIDDKIAELTEIHNEFTKTKHIFNVLCKKIGQTELKLIIKNQLTTPNFTPYLSKFITTVYCVKPRFINLYTTEKLRQSCPLKLKNSIMHVNHNDERGLEVGIEILDAENRKLMNISSLVLNWQFLLEDSSAIQMKNNLNDQDIEHRQESENEHFAGVEIPLRDYLITQLPDVQSNYKIKGIVQDYDRSVLNKYGIYAESPVFGIQKSPSDAFVKPIIENELSFLTVNSTLLPYNELSIYLSKNKQERVTISQGSGSYEINVSEQSIVNVELDAQGRELIITPLRIGNVRVELIDRCLMTEPSILQISVVSIGRIVVHVPDRVEKTKTIEAIVQLYDSMDHLMVLDLKNLGIYELHEDVFNGNVLNVKLGKQINLNVGEIRYIVTGLELGDTKIVFYSGYNGNLIKSQPVTVQVFPPLRLYPRNSTIIVGTNVQIYSHGGPHPDVNIVYTVENENVVSMDSSIALALKLGTTKITGKCVGVSPTTGKQIIFSQDTVQINVKLLDKIKIVTPLIRIKSGAVMPATLWGEPDISPMILGTLPYMSVAWSTNQPDVISIIGIFSDAGIEYDGSDSISVRIRAINPGKAKIQATITTVTGKQNVYVEITVFKMLELESPKRIVADTILIPPNFNINLKANLVDVIYQKEVTSGATTNNNGAIVQVTRDGMVKSSEILGRDLIIATSSDQTLSIPIEVKNIHYLLATVHHSSDVKLKQTETKIPRGMNIMLKVTLHDNLGNEFSHNLEDINTLKCKLSRKEMAEIYVGGNFTIGINLPRESSGMLAISLKDTSGVKYSEDFIKLSVAQSQHIFPTKTIFSVGDIICFDSPLTYSTNWISSDDSVIEIDRRSGIGRVLSSRSQIGEKIIVSNGDKQQGHINYDLEIREADKIAFIKHNDIFNGDTYVGHILIKNHLQIDKTSNLIARNTTTCNRLLGGNVAAGGANSFNSAAVDKVTVNFFVCKLKLLNGGAGNNNNNNNNNIDDNNKVLDNFKVNAMFDKRVGSYACQIQLLTSIEELINLVQNVELNFELEARLNSGITDSVTLKMVPGIKVFPTVIGIEQLNKQTITITGLNKVLQNVEVKSSHPSIIEIVHLTSSSSPGSLQFTTKLIDTFPITGLVDPPIMIEVISPLSQQTIEIKVQSEHLINTKCSSQPSFFNMSTTLLIIVSNVGLIISALIVLAVTVWLFVYCFSGRNSVTTTTDSVFATPFKNGTSKPHVSPGSGSAFTAVRGPSYPNSPMSPSSFLNSSGSPNVSSGGGGNSTDFGTTVYGDSTLISPQKRVNRRYM